MLRYFLETAREGNMTRAAERLFVSQPTMSRQLKELEEELGVKLFHRSNYSIKLTEAGMLLRDRAEDILTLVDKTEAEFRSFEEDTSGDIYIGAPESESMRLFAEAVQDLQQEFPGIRCHIYSGAVLDVCERLDIRENDRQFKIFMVDNLDPEFRNAYLSQSLQLKSHLGILFPEKIEPYVNAYIMNGSAGLILEWIKTGYSLDENEVVEMLFSVQFPCHIRSECVNRQTRLRRKKIRFFAGS